MVVKNDDIYDMKSRNIDLSYWKVRYNMTEIEAKKEFKERLELIEKCYRGEVEDYKQALELGVKALEKQIPKKVTLEGDGYSDGHLVYDTWICPLCEKRYEVDYDDYDYCPNCGQKLDWSDEE